MNTEDRLRTHPKERLAPPMQRIDLSGAIAKLRAEPHGSVTGHRQLALVRRGPVSLILFAFDPDGSIKEHQAEGEVTIHVLNGRIDVIVACETVSLGSGELVSLAPGQPHSVRASEQSEMLLTICKIN